MNAIVVDATTTTPTIFAKVLGINSFTIHAKGTAMMSQGNLRPLTSWSWSTGRGR